MLVLDVILGVAVLALRRTRRGRQCGEIPPCAGLGPRSLAGRSLSRSIAGMSAADEAGPGRLVLSSALRRGSPRVHSEETRTRAKGTQMIRRILAPPGHPAPGANTEIAVVEVPPR